MSEQVTKAEAQARMSNIPTNIEGALRGANRELLVGLRESVLAGCEQIPLPRTILRRIAVLSDAQIEHCSRGGLMLIDLKALLTAPLEQADEVRASAYDANHWRRSPGWLSPVQFVSLAHSALLMAWHMAHWDADSAAVVMGVERAFVQQLTQWEASEISEFVRQFGHLVTPRWHLREDVWHDLLSLGAWQVEESAVSMAVRGLQLSGSMYRAQTGGAWTAANHAKVQFGRKLGSIAPLSVSQT